MNTFPPKPGTKVYYRGFRPRLHHVVLVIPVHPGDHCEHVVMRYYSPDRGWCYVVETSIAFKLLYCATRAEAQP